MVSKAGELWAASEVRRRLMVPAALKAGIMIDSLISEKCERSNSKASFSFTPLKSHLSNLLRNEAHHKNDN